MTTAARRFGDPLADLTDERPLSETQIAFLPIDLVVQWSRCGMIADFLADYLAYNFENRVYARQVISTGLNELLENAVKFSIDKQHEATLSLAHYGDFVRIETRNVTDAAHVEALAEVVERLTTHDTEDLFVQQLEFTATESQTASGLGLITMRKDYKSAMSVEVTPTGDRYQVCFTLELGTDDLENEPAVRP